MRDFSVRMINQLQFSNCSAPHWPITAKQIEALLVQLSGDFLTITQIAEHGSLGSRLYAQRTLELPPAIIFMILPRLPSGVSDGSFFSALGTAALLPGE